jgi:ribosomal protein S18 acetylase RimI-like enzyme
MRDLPHYGGHVYSSKTNPHEAFTVRPVEGDDPNLPGLALLFQKIKRLALTEQMESKVSPEGVVFTANEEDQVLVAEQERNISSSSYVMAETAAAGAPHATIIGFGRSSEGSNLGLEVPRVSIREVYVAPEYQNRGVGTAILRSLLDEKPRDAITVAFNSVELNPRAEGLLESLGFIASHSLSIYEDWFGNEEEVTAHTGPTVGSLIADLQQRNAWLSQRVAFSSHEQPLKPPQS